VGKWRLEERGVAKERKSINPTLNGSRAASQAEPMCAAI
jgi:hypothetical protein